MTATNGTAKWQLWFSAAGLGVLLVGALMVLYVQVSTAYQTANDLKTRVDKLSSQVDESRNELSVICADLREVETQFKGSDQIRNLMHLNDLRIQSMLWRKSFNSDYPTDGAYLPTIAQDQPTPCR